jgi:metal-responsive CopG/Arc/MetJ family transcriptional regulator
MRIQVNLSEKMVNKIDYLAENMGVSRSALCSTIIGQYVMGLEKSFEAIENKMSKMIDEK